MSGGGVEQASGVRNHEPPPFGRQSSAPTYSQSQDDAHSFSSLEVSPTAPFAPLASLNNTTYSPLRSGVDSACSASTNRLPSTSQSRSRRGRESPNPDDYYRQRDGLGPKAAGDFGDVTVGASNSMANGYRNLNDRVSPLPANVLDPSRTRRQAYRSTSDSPTLGGPSINVSPSVPSIRSRQSSFKDLISKFEQKPDQVLSFPSASRSTSRTASPAGSADGTDRSCALPRRQLRDSVPPGFVTSNPRSQVGPNPPSPKAERLGDTNGGGVPPPLLERIPKSYRQRPLFGELLSVDTQLHTLGFGIPSHLRRRGSDGSIPSPNTAFADQSNPPSARSPLTPTAWYRGQTSSLEAVNAGANTFNGHRRAHSDFTGAPQREPLADPWSPNMAVSVPLQQTKPDDGSPGSPSSRSRIPVSSHRLVTGSGPESLSPTANSTFRSRSNAIPLASKGTSRLPKPSVKDSPPRMTEDVPASFAMTARGRRDMTIGRTRNPVPERNQHLQAYISVPPPKKSPPLRSSRPRQPVSHGAPVSPRSKIGERVSSLQKYADRDPEARSPRPRQRRLPELGDVDFETRRRRIQQAFNRTVQENERKEEEAVELQRRRTQKREEGGEAAGSPADEKTLTPTTAATLAPPPAEMATVVTESTGPPGEDDKAIRTVPQLHLNTTLTGPEDNAPHTTMDSPTLGVPDGGDRESRRAVQKSNPADDAVPTSAVTTGSDDTHVTHFDPEPQSELVERKPSLSHRTLLNQIMQIRESSDSSDSCDEPDCSLSENDEKQSIQIMLRDTNFYNSTSTTDTEEPRQVAQRSQEAGPPQNRWSMSSWSSSLHHHHDTCDEVCDGSGDDIALPMPTPGQVAQEPTTQSCSAASTSPLSDMEDAPIQDLGVMGPDTLNNTPQLTSGSVFSTPPSLARQGRWDSRRVTQLYLEELARGRNNTIPLAPSRNSQDYGTLEVDTRTDGQAESLTNELVFVPGFQEVPVLARPSHSASLVGRDDWEHASPSIMDWMQIAAEDEATTPATDRLGFVTDGVPTPRLMNSAVELDASIQPNSGLGLSVNARDPNVPQPPPVGHPAEIAKSGEESQPGHNHQAHVGRVPTLRDAVHSTGSSEDSSFRRLEPAQSPQAADSSATSLAPSVEHAVRSESKKSPSPEQRRLKKRRHIIKELVDTEHTFGRDMKVVDDIYKGTSGSCLDLSADDVKILFANSDQVVQFSTTFQDALKKAARSVYIMPKSQRWTSRRSAHNNRPGSSEGDEQVMAEAGKSELEKDRASTVGEAFMTHMANLEKVYSDYLKNHDAANKKLQILQRNPKVAIWLKECRDWASDLTSAWDLDSLLVKPVQRILKYPLLLAELLESTPKDHPDHMHLSNALQEVTNISVRINEMKKRADLVGQVVGRKRNQSDVRTGLSKAFGRRTEKLRQQVGLSDMFEDKVYDSLADKFGEQYVQLRLMIRDVEDYIEYMKKCMMQFNELVATIEGIIDVSQTNYAELESKWRQFKVSVREIITTALPEHIDVVTKACIDPTAKVIALYNGPERVMKKRNKRLLDYARYKAVADRGDKPDKKTTEQGEQFVALNETLKDELPRLYALSGKFGQACLKNLVQIQVTWWNVLQQKIGAHVETFPDDLQKMISDWNSDYTFSEAQVLSLGICNGSLLADTVNLVNFNTPSTGVTANSPRRPSTVNSSNPRPDSMVEDSPKVSYDYGTSQLFQSPQMGSQSGTSRHRADSSYSARVPPSTPDVGRSQLLQQVTNSSGSGSGSGSHVTKTTDTEPFPSLPKLSLDTPLLADMINVSTSENNPPTSPADWYPNFFSSAMPMSDAPNEAGDPEGDTPKPPKVLFLAASIYEFNIDRARREAGYPYLTYVAGEIFDVIGEKGELWLARNQDDSTNQVGWIWNKHFAKLSS